MQLEYLQHLQPVPPPRARVGSTGATPDPPPALPLLPRHPIQGTVVLYDVMTNAQWRIWICVMSEYKIKV